MAPSWDVAVVGAGPAGAVSSALLAGGGFRVLLVDRAHFPRSKACAEYVSPGTVEILDRLGLTESWDGLHPQPIAGMDIISPRGKSFSLRYEGHGRTLYAHGAPRDRLDAMLVRHAVQSGAELWEGFVAHAPVVERGRVLGVRGSRHGSRSEIRARLTIVADGSRSSMTRLLGLAVAPRWPVRLGLVAHYAGTARLPAHRGAMHVGRGGYCGIAPLPDGLLNVAVVAHLDALRRTKLSATSFFEAWISGDSRLRETLDGCGRVTQVRGVVPLGSRSRRAWMPGALLVGDAAGFFDPFTGEGIFRAVRGAQIAADIAGAALIAGNVDNLGAYSRLRARAFRRKAAVSTIVQLFVQYPALMEYALPRLSERHAPSQSLGLVLGDLADAGRFLNLGMLWATLRP